MKKAKPLFLTLLLSLSMMFTSCGSTASSSQISSTGWMPDSAEVQNAVTLIMKAEVNSERKTALLTIYPEDDSAVFNSSISKEEIVLYAINNETQDTLLITDFTVVFINQSSIQLSLVSFEGDYDSFSVAIKESASKTGTVLLAYGDAVEGKGNSNSDVSGDISPDDIAKIKAALNDTSIFDTLSGLAGQAVSAYSGITAVLKMLGIMEDPVKSAVLDIKRSVEALSGQITTLSSDMKAMYTSLDAKLSKISSNVQKLLYIENERTWEDFRTDYIIKSGIQKQIDNFNSYYTQKYIGFSKKTSGDFTLYYDTKGNLTYPANKIHDEGEDWESIDKTVIDEKKTITFAITEKTFAKTEGLTQKSLDDDTYMDTLKADLKAGLLTASGVTELNVDKYLEDALSELDNYSTREAMNTTTDGGILANDIITNFNEYCAALTRSSSNPISAYRYLITSSYNFQSEAKEDLQSFDNYIRVQTETYKNYVDLASKVGNITNAAKESANTAKTSLVTYLDNNTGLMPDKDGCQYCYVTNSYVKANQYTAMISMSITAEISYRFFYYSAAYKTNSFSCTWFDTHGTPVSYPKDTIGTEEAKAIYAIYSTMKEKGKVTGSFNDYYQSCLTNIQSDDVKNSYLSASAMISGSSYNFTDFALDGSVNLTCYSNAFVDNCGATGHGGDYFRKGSTYAIGKSSEGNKATSNYYVQHKAVKADVMDMTAETFSDNAEILYGAIYAEDHGSWQVPETWLFAGAPSFKGGNNWWHTSYAYPASYVSGSGTVVYSVTIIGTYWTISIV